MSIQESNKLTPIAYRVAYWFNMETRKPVFGIDVATREEKGWFHMMEDGKPCFWQTEEEAIKVFEELDRTLFNSQPSNTTP